MVFIYGGAYLVGDSSSFGPDFLIEKNVILVTFNYRLGPFGFLSLGTPSYSGNMGLKDQRLVLIWIQNNIKYFGGNRNLVTIFGQSAGSSSVSLHITSPSTRGLFKRAIMESGSSLNTFAYKSTTNQLGYILQFAKQYSNNSSALDAESLVDFLIHCDADKIQQKTFRKIVQWSPLPIHVNILWAPVIEGKRRYKLIFL